MNDDHVQTEYSNISNNITIGTNMCCAHHFDKLFDLKFDADIDLEEAQAEKPQHVEMYLWLPTNDHTAPSQDQLMLGAFVLDKLVKENKRVYVHCRQGHGRSPTLVVAYFILTGMTTSVAIAYVKSKRPEMHLEGNQEEELRVFEKQYKDL